MNEPFARGPSREYMAAHQATEAAFHVKEREQTMHAFNAWWVCVEREAALWLFGRELLSLKACKDEPTQQPEPPRMEGGSGHNFKRDLAPPNPTGEESWQDRGLGFR